MGGVSRCCVVGLGLVLLSCGDDGIGATGGASGSSGASGETSATTGPVTATTTSGGTSASAAGETGTTGSDPFVHEWGTEFTPDGRLALRSNLPPQVAQCQMLSGASCDDADGDGWVDAWEDVVLDRMRPLRRFDEAEAAVNDAAAVFADVGRVIDDGAGAFRVFVMLGYSRDYGSCGGFTSHNGDSERVALALDPWPDGGPGGVVVAQAYTAAHEGTINDQGRMFSGDELSQLVFDADAATGEPRWVVFPSADKHATYATVAICEGISVIPCVDEDCGPDGVADPAAFDVLPMSANAGEELMPRLTDLTGVGFPGDDAWVDQEFCGGLGGTGCSSSVRSKLLADPF